MAQMCRCDKMQVQVQTGDEYLLICGAARFIVVRLRRINPLTASDLQLILSYFVLDVGQETCRGRVSELIWTKWSAFQPQDASNNWCRWDKKKKFNKKRLVSVAALEHTLP